MCIVRQEAEALLRNRQCTTGGWNYGNAEVLGKKLYAYTPTTALGLLALSDAWLAARDSRVIEHSLERDIPLVGLIGGGYDKDRALLARRHAHLHFSAARSWQRYGLG